MTYCVLIHFETCFAWSRTLDPTTCLDFQNTTVCNSNTKGVKYRRCYPFYSETFCLTRFWRRTIFCVVYRMESGLEYKNPRNVCTRCTRSFEEWSWMQYMRNIYWASGINTCDYFNSLLPKGFCGFRTAACPLKTRNMTNTAKHNVVFIVVLK